MTVPLQLAVTDDVAPGSCDDCDFSPQEQSALRVAVPQSFVQVHWQVLVSCWPLFTHPVLHVHVHAVESYSPAHPISKELGQVHPQVISSGLNGEAHVVAQAVEQLVNCCSAVYMEAVALYTRSWSQYVFEATAHPPPRHCDEFPLGTMLKQ